MMPILMNEASFQAAFYYSLIIFGIAVVSLIGGGLAFRTLGPMWRDGNKSLAVGVGVAAGLILLTLLLMLLTVIIALYPYAAGTQ